MRLNKLLMLCFTALLVFSCNNDDDDGPEIIPPRDRGEVAIEDDQTLIEYLSTHFYNYEEFDNPSEDFDYRITIDTIAGENADKTPILDMPGLTTEVVNYRGVDQNLYVLKVREGAGEMPHFSDSTYVAYQGKLLNDNIFDDVINQGVWFDLSGYEVRNPQTGNISTVGGVIEGFAKGIQNFRSSTGFVVNEDNTVTWNNDYGIGAVFMPSGLGYFATNVSGIPTYSPLIFELNLYSVNVADHDDDGIPSYMEDLNGNRDAFDDDTDDDDISNHSDPDDDGDGKLTRDEIEIAEDGTVIFTDSNGDGTPDYLDPDTF